MTTRHFLSLMDLTPDEIRQIIARAIEMKKELAGSTSPRHAGPGHASPGHASPGHASPGHASPEHANLAANNPLLHNRTAVLVFEKSSTRTRVSFETGITQLGGNAIFLAPSDSHLSRGEPIEDTARVLSRMASLIILRTSSHRRVELMAEYATVPVINALSDFNHPCQQLADIQTWTEHQGEISGRKAAWIGDGNNVCHSWMNAARQLDFSLSIATPAGYEPSPELTSACGTSVTLTNDPVEAAMNADLVVTDAWASMGQEQEKTRREEDFAGFCVDQSLLSLARDNALFMHCLPAYRGQEVSAEVIDGPQSVIWDEAENRLHAQKALMEFLLA